MCPTLWVHFIFSPFSTAYDVTVTRGEIPIKQVLPEEELNLVIQNATTGKEYIYHCIVESWGQNYTVYSCHF